MFIIRIYYPGGHFDLAFDSPQYDVGQAIRQFRQIWPDQPIDGVSVFQRENNPTPGP